MDAVYIATTPSATGDQDFAIPQNAVMRSYARSYARAYWDGYSIFQSYAEATALGYTVGDGTHFNAAGGFYLGTLLWNDLWSTSIDIRTIDETNVRLEWFSHTNFFYQLQEADSLNATNWSNLGAPIRGTGGMVAQDEGILPYKLRYYRVKTFF